MTNQDIFLYFKNLSSDRERRVLIKELKDFRNVLQEKRQSKRREIIHKNCNLITDYLMELKIKFSNSSHNISLRGTGANLHIKVIEKSLIILWVDKLNQLPVWNHHRVMGKLRIEKLTIQNLSKLITQSINLMKTEIVITA